MKQPWGELRLKLDLTPEEGTNGSIASSPGPSLCEMQNPIPESELYSLGMLEHKIAVYFLITAPKQII